jgi:hypothetical protein
MGRIEQVFCLQQKLKNGGWGLWLKDAGRGLQKIGRSGDRRDRENQHKEIAGSAVIADIARDRKSPNVHHSAAEPQPKKETSSTEAQKQESTLTDSSLTRMVPVE